MIPSTLICALKKQDTATPVSYLNYDINEGRLFVAVLADAPLVLQMSIYREGVFGSRQEKVIYDKPVSAGKHTFQFEENILAGFGKNFLNVYINEEAYYTQRL